MKRIVTLQDISCVGKCSLAVALPIISTMGIEACPIPTALLSNHTAFNSFYFHDLTQHMNGIFDEFKKQKFNFDGIYSAYLGSKEQVNVVCDFIDKFKNDSTITLIDPVMGDHGKLYSGFDDRFPEIMKKLCAKADIIVPNITEAGFLLDKGGALTYSSTTEIKDYARQLCSMGPKLCVITGVEENNKLGAIIYNSETDEFDVYLRDKIERTFHGTGDIFASVLFSCLIKERPIKNALKCAVDFTYLSMEATMNNPDSNWYGVDFESVLPALSDM